MATVERPDGSAAEAGPFKSGPQATMNDEGLADVEAANPFVYPDFTQQLVWPSGFGGRRCESILSRAVTPAGLRPRCAIDIGANHSREVAWRHQLSDRGGECPLAAQLPVA